MADRPTTAGTKTSENVTSETSSHADAAQTEKDTTTSATIPLKKPFLDSLPPWVSTNLRSSDSWKLLARCWLASWVAFLFLLPQASLNTLGNTYVSDLIFGHWLSYANVGHRCSAFFTVLTSLFVPPNLPIQMFLFVSAHLMHRYR